MRCDLRLLSQWSSNSLHASLAARQESKLQAAPSALDPGIRCRSLSSVRRRPHFRHWKTACRRRSLILNDEIRNVVAYSGYPDRPSKGQGFRPVGDFEWRMQSMFQVLVLDRYLLREMTLPFLAALAVGSILGVSLGAFVSLAREVVAAGLPLRVALLASFLQLPHFWSQTMPAACMAASLFSLNRLQGDMELLVMLATGVPIGCLMRAPIYLGILGALLQLACIEYAVPFANERSVNMIQSFLTTNVHMLHQRDDVIYPEYDKSGGSQKMQRVWHAKRFEGDLMKGVLMLDFSKSGQVKRVLLADECELVWNQCFCKFVDSTIIDINMDSAKHLIVQVKTLELPCLIISKSSINRKINMQNLSRHSISLRIESLKSKLKTEFVQMSEDNLPCKSFKKGNIGFMLATSEQSCQKSPVDVKWQQKALLEKSLLKAECSLLQHDASICSCIIFSLIGTISMLMVGHIESRSQAFSRAFVASIICAGIYNSLVTLAAVAGQRKLVSPIMSAWLPCLLALLVGLSCIAWKILQEAKVQFFK